MSTFVKQSGMTTDHVDWGTIGWRRGRRTRAARRSS